jgi:hypothetical protein
VSGVGGTSCTSGTLIPEIDSWVLPLYFSVSLPFVGAGVDTGAPEPASSCAADGGVDLWLGERFEAGALAPSALESFPLSSWAIARGLVAPSVPDEGLCSNGAVVELPGASATPAGLEVEARFCDVVSNFPIRFATEGRGRSSGSGLFQDGENDQRRVGIRGA